MAAKRLSHQGGSSSTPLVRSDPSLAIESSLSTNDNLILKEIKEYAPDPQDDEDNVNRLVKIDEEEEEGDKASILGSLPAIVSTT